MRSASESPRPAMANCNRPRGKQVGKFNVMRFRVAAASCGQWQYSTWSSGFPSASFLQLFGVFVNLVCTANLSPLFGFSSTQKWAVEWKTTKNRFYAQWFHPQGHVRISSLKKNFLGSVKSLLQGKQKMIKIACRQLSFSFFSIEIQQFHLSTYYEQTLWETNQPIGRGLQVKISLSPKTTIASCFRLDQFQFC